MAARRRLFPDVVPLSAPRLRVWKAFALLITMAAGCSPAASVDNPRIQLTETAIEVTGLSQATLDLLENARLTDEQWSSVLRVAVAADAPPMLGSYAMTEGGIRFTPAFPLDPGRQYQVSYIPSGVPQGANAGAVVTATVGLPDQQRQPSTIVSHVYPSGDEIPENVLRMYVEFSAPMGRKSGVEYITLLNSSGQEIPGAVLPLEYEFWSPDHRRFTVFFDPGRVKQGILPNREMGRAFVPGQTVTLVISADWRDEHGQPLRNEYRRTFHVAAADVQPVDPSQWRITAPAASGRSPLVVRFPEPLDHGLLMRALGVRRDGAVVGGDAQVVDGEREWRFIPGEPWRPGSYQLLALEILEDLAGNQIGKAFEVDNFDTVDKSPEPQSVELPFVIR